MTHTYYSDLRAFLSNGSTTVQLFADALSDEELFTINGADLNGNYTFVTTGANWYTQSHPVPSATTYASLQPLSAFDGSSLNGTWTLNVQDSSGGDIGSFQSFTITATPVPFEFSPVPGLVLLGGAWLVRGNLKKRSAQKMLVKSVNS